MLYIASMMGPNTLAALTGQGSPEGTVGCAFSFSSSAEKFLGETGISPLITSVTAAIICYLLCAIGKETGRMVLWCHPYAGSRQVVLVPFEGRHHACNWELACGETDALNIHMCSD